MAAYQVLARKYRPLRFSDVVGQAHVTRTLLNALAQNRIAHGYIFSGHRGIGKTTIARILASALNCRNEIGSAARPTPEPCNQCESCLEIRQGNAVDVIEIDAATNRGIEDVRELRDAARYQPSRDKYKIIILDEAHQITDAAFNALLKTLEEPPDHIVFMFATTQPEDIPQTIRSRCQHFSFHAVKLDDILGQLRGIANAENILTDDATLALLAEAGDGSMRDALSIMDQAIASAPTIDGKPSLEIQQVRELMGSVSNVVYEKVLAAVHANSSSEVLSVIGELLDAGNGAPQIARQFVRFLRNCVVAKITALQPDAEATGIAADLLQISPEERSRAARSASLFTEEELSRFLSIMLRTFDELGYRQEQRFHLELGLLKLVHMQRLIPIEELLSQLGTAPAKVTNAVSTTPLAKPSLPLATPVMASTPPPAAAFVSPFETDRNRKTPQASATQAIESSSTDGALALATEQAPNPVAKANERPHLVPPAPKAEASPQPIAPAETKLVADSSQLVAETTKPFPEISASPAPPAQTLGTLNLEALQSAIVARLAESKGQSTASEQMEDSTFTLKGDTLEIQTTLSKTMLPVGINAEAVKLMTAVLREHGAAGIKLTLLPGVAAPAAAKKPKVARAGSAAELAENHPVVQEAKRLFSADISNIIDLRKD